MNNSLRVSAVIPALNEEQAIVSTIQLLKQTLQNCTAAYEIIVVDDGSTDRTAEIARAQENVKVIQHPSNGGYGLSLKHGIQQAQYEYIVITDADGTYPIHEIPNLLSYVPAFDMVVGARKGKFYRGQFFKYPSRKAFLWLSEFATGRHIDDINSGLRVFRRDLVVKFFDTLSHGFSFTTTITLAFMLNGHFVKYLPIDYHKRIGKSHVRYVRDTLRSAQIIVQAILYYNPLKLFLLLGIISFGFGILLLILGFILDSQLFIGGFINAVLAMFVIFALGLCADLIRRIRE